MCVFCVREVFCADRIVSHKKRKAYFYIREEEKEREREKYSMKKERWLTERKKIIKILMCNDLDLELIKSLVMHFYMLQKIFQIKIYLYSLEEVNWNHSPARKKTSLY